MKKKALRVLACAMALVMLCAGALAEGSATAIFESARALAFNTDNVTLSAEAKFTFDGEWFKTLHGDYLQAGEDSFMRVMLDTPYADGSVYTGGYTVIGNGSHVFYNDTKQGNYYMETTTAPSSSVLRNTTLTQAVTALAGAAVQTLDSDLSAHITETEVTSGRSFDVSFDRVPALLNDAMTYVLVEYINTHYFNKNLTTYSDATFIYEDYSELLKHCYRTLYGEDMPESIYDDMYSANKKKAASAQEKYDKASNAVNEITNNALNERDSGMLYVRTDGTYQWYEDEEDYMRAEGIKTVIYTDFDAALRLYYEKTYGQTYTDEMAQAIMNSTNEELWNAYLAVTSAMEQSYIDEFKDDKEAVSVLVRADGTAEPRYHITNDSDTVTRRIMRMFNSLTLDSLKATVKMDEASNLTSAAGTAEFTIKDRKGKAHALKVEFNFVATDYGTTKVDEFDAEKLGFVTYEEFMKQTTNNGDKPVIDGENETETQEWNWNQYQELLKSLPRTITFAGQEYDTGITVE